MLTRAIRNFTFRLHAWVGLNLSIIFFALFATGTVLPFGYEVEALFFPQMQTPATASPESLATPGQIYDSVRSAYPDVQVGRMVIRHAEFVADSSFVSTRWGENFRVWTNPSTAEVLGTTPQTALRSFLVDFHKNFLLRMTPGSLAVLAFSVLLTGMLISGMITYRRFWKGFFRLPQGPVGSRGWWGGLHRLIGVWLLPFLMIIAVTGLYFLSGWLGLKPVAPRPDQPVERATILPPGFNGNTVDQALALAMEETNGLEIVSLSIPYARKQGIEFSIKTSHALFGQDITRIYIDPTTMSVLGNFSEADMPGGVKIRTVAHSLHYGTWAGRVSEWLWVAFGLCTSLLALSGVLIFAKRIAPRPQDAPKGTALGRAWRGMFVIKWGIVICLIGAVGLWTFRYSGMVQKDWTRIYSRVPRSEADLFIGQRPESGAAMNLRLQLAQSDGKGVEWAFNDQALEPDFQQVGSSVQALATVTASEGRNKVTATLPNRENQMIWFIGRPMN